MKIRAILAAVVLGIAALVPVAAAAPANAGWPGGQVVHAADDSGFNPPISVKCNNGAVYQLGLGTESRRYCSDVDYVYNGWNAHLECQHIGSGVWQRFSSVGWHALNSDFTAMRCYQQKDNVAEERAHFRSYWRLAA